MHCGEGLTIQSPHPQQQGAIAGSRFGGREIDDEIEFLRLLKLILECRD